MNSRVVRPVLWLHTLIMGIPGILFFALPNESASLWAWTLPPLAARFVGSLFIGGACCSLYCLRERRGLFVMVLMAVGDILIALTGILGIGDTGLTAALLGFLIFFLGIALVVIAVMLPAARAVSNLSGASIPSALRVFFLIHLLVVLPVGLTMYFAPVWTQPLWPWTMTPINVRLLGSFFLGASFISIWALRQRFYEPVRPALVLYTFFATFATIASLLHFSLFNPTRLATWAFFALYVFVAAGSAFFWWFGSARRVKPALA